MRLTDSFDSLDDSNVSLKRFGPGSSVRETDLNVSALTGFRDGKHIVALVARRPSGRPARNTLNGRRPSRSFDAERP